MTITKKVGALLLLLTIGSFVGTLTFALFLRNSSLELLYMAASLHEQRLLQDLYTNSIMIRDGHDELRGPQHELIREFDGLLNTLENGGPNPSHLSPIDITERFQAAASVPGSTLATTGPEIVQVLTETLPALPAELHENMVTLRGQWLRLKESFSVAAERPAGETSADESFELIKERMPAISQTSRVVAIAAGARLVEVRRRMLNTLVLIAGLSVILFSAGLLLTRRFITRPIQRLQSASHRIGSGNFSYRVPDTLTSASDELAALGKTFNEMANQIERSLVAKKMEALGRLAGTIAHDFGNVLTIVNGYCTLIQKNLKKDDPLQADVEGIQKATQRAIAMIRQLLSLSKEPVITRKVIAADKVISEMTGALRRLIGDNIELTTRVALPLGHINIDPTQFEQIFVNLVLNARDAMPQGGKIRIEARNMDVIPPEGKSEHDLSSGPYLRFKVTDTGRGMSPEVLSQIFEPFFSTKTQGTGLGLSSVYSIVRQAGGQISAESQPGVGTTITIYLPRVLEAPAIAVEAVSPADGQG